MKFQNVCIEAFGYSLPEEIWTSEEIEQRLEPLYSRLNLPVGRLELMTGIRERRFWSRSVRPSQPSIASCRHALAAAELDPSEVGLLVHGSVCRDFLEPATACGVHHALGLPPACMIYDLSNACLGILNGMLNAAVMIESGAIRAALVVGSELGRGLVETTIAALNRDQSLTRKSIKDSFASLTIGSASCAVLLVRRDLSRSHTRLVNGVVRANTRWHALCQSDHDLAGADFQPLMATDSTELLTQGVQTGVDTFGDFLAATGWTRESIDRTVCHQVGVAHRKLMLDSLGLPVERDQATFAWLGNTGSAALPITAARAAEEGGLKPGERVALLGIGSGINCVMLACEWGATAVRGGNG
ncbi:MAG: 3-oxoacyl-ACP synthase III [Planctomycetota bacterium]|jgi:3-oxoacyl-[acyl-carrier-protein] synthase III